MEEERFAKKRKLFQDALPAEMIENIVLLCPNIITLSSLACTCKQIRDVVSKMPKKRIEASFKMSQGRSWLSQADFMINSDGDVIKESKYYQRAQGSRTEKIRTVMKKLEQRYLFDELYKEIREILNMTDLAKITKLIETEDLNTDVLRLNVERMELDVEIDGIYSNYSYISGTASNADIIKLKQMNPDLHVSDPATPIDWNSLDDKMISRFKCALCVIKTRNVFKKIPFMERRGDKSITIEYRKDAAEGEGWDFNMNDSGHLYARAFEVDVGPWQLVDEKNKIERSFQIRPSLAEEIFVELEKHFNSKVIKSFSAKYGEDENSDQNSGSDLAAENKSDDESAENENIDEEYEDEDYEASFEGRRTVIMTLNGTKLLYNLPARFFEELMEVIQPVQRMIDFSMGYE